MFPQRKKKLFSVKYTENSLEWAEKREKNKKEQACTGGSVQACSLADVRENNRIPLCRNANCNISDEDHFFFFFCLSDLYMMTRFFSFTPVSWVSSTGPEWKRSCSR